MLKEVVDEETLGTNRIELDFRIRTITGHIEMAYPVGNQNPQGNNGYPYNPNYNQPPVNYNDQYASQYNNSQYPAGYNPDPTPDQNDYNQTPDPYQSYQDLN